jgi:hypothetical protein
LRFAAHDANDPNQIIWKKIEQVSPDVQNLMALAFKERWQVEQNWNVKPKQKKQWEKVQKVKAILGEG